jgi:DNA-binding response OmpR family regulator
MKKRIMVVDNDPKVCRGIQKILAITRHSVYFAFDAVTAVAEARKHQPDLMIVDLSLPAGSGLIVVERLRMLPELAAVPVIMIAERGARLEAERVFQAGANAFVPKPLDPYVLLDYVGRLLPTEDAANMWVEATRLRSGELA